MASDQKCGGQLLSLSPKALGGGRVAGLHSVVHGRPSNGRLEL